MKLLLSTLFTMLIIGSAGGSYGQETIRYSHGDIYVGGIHNRSRSGYGTMNYANGETYDGEWWEGQRSGYGTYINETIFYRT